MPNLRLGGLSLLLLVSACGNPDDLAYAEDDSPTTLIGPPTATFEPSERDLITFHAAWLCEFQRRTFSTPDEGRQALAEQLRRSGVDATDYHEFRVRLEDSQDRRDAVLYAYQENCLR